MQLCSPHSRHDNKFLLVNTQVSAVKWRRKMDPALFLQEEVMLKKPYQAPKKFQKV